jgi:hypothetical protein
MSSEQAMSVGESDNAPIVPQVPEFTETTVEGTDAGAPAGQAVEHILRTRLPEELDAALESPDPVAGLDHALQTVADELSRLTQQAAPEPGRAGVAEPDREFTGAIEALVRVALETDDPIAALEEGAESLAEALAARDLAEQERQRVAEEQWVDQQAAYQHARFHRVSELIDVGYSLDQAIAITNMNEAEIRARAAAVGLDPMAAIYRYAVLNGYQASRARPDATSENRQLPGLGGNKDDPILDLADLAQLSDEAFAEATRGDRWRTLMRS